MCLTVLIFTRFTYWIFPYCFLAITCKRKRVQSSRIITGEPNRHQRRHHQGLTDQDIGTIDGIACQVFDDIAPEAIPDGI
jgi:hypothetical protein